MKVSLAGLLSNARSMIPELEPDEDDTLDDDFDYYSKYQDCPSHCPASELLDDDVIMYHAMYRDLLQQTADNVRAVCENPAQLQDFLELYGLPSVADYLQAVEDKKTEELRQIITGESFRRFFGTTIMNINAVPEIGEVQTLVAQWCGAEKLNQLVAEGMNQRKWQHLQKKFEAWSYAEAAKREVEALDRYENEGGANA